MFKDTPAQNINRLLGNGKLKLNSHVTKYVKIHKVIKSSAELATEFAFSLPLMPIWLGTQHKIMYFLAKFKKTLSYHYPNQGMFHLHRL